MITIISKPSCAPCRILKRILDAQLDYEYLEFKGWGQNQERINKLLATSTAKQVPQLFINEQFIASGLREILSALKSKRLIEVPNNIRY